MENRLYLQYLGACLFKNRIYFCNGGVKGLFSFDLDSFTVRYENSIPYLSNSSQWAYLGNCNCIYGNKIYFFPYNCNQIMEYDTINRNLDKITIQSSNNVYMTAGIFQIEEKIWIFPGILKQGIYILDLKTSVITKDEEFDKLLEKENNIYNYDNFIRINEYEAVFLSGINKLIKLDIKRKKIVEIKQFDRNLNIFAIRYDGNNFWLLTNDTTDVYEWNPDSNVIEKYVLLHEDWINGFGKPYANIIFVNGKVFLLPSRLKYILKLDRQRHLIEKAVNYPRDFLFLNNQFENLRWPAFAAFHILDNKNLILHPVLGNKLLIYNIENNELKEISFHSKSLFSIL